MINNYNFYQNNYCYNNNNNPFINGINLRNDIKIKNRQLQGNESIESNLSNDYTISENNNPKDHPFDNFFEVKEIFNEIKDEIKSVNTYNINDNEVKENSLNDIISEKEK